MKRIPSNIISFFGHFIWQWKWNFAAMFSCILMWPIGETFGPYLLGLIIDGIVKHQGPHDQIFLVVALPLAGFIVLWLAYYIILTGSDIILLKTIPVMKGQMRQTLFEYVQDHSSRYFQEHLAGSISNKIKDIGDSFDAIFKAIHHGIYPTAISFFLAMAFLWQTHPSFSIFIGIWGLLLTIGTIYLAIKCVIASEDAAEGQTVLVGKIVDSLSNSSTVQMFTQAEYETSYLKSYQSIAAKKEEVAEWAMINIHIFTSIFCMGLILGMLLLLIYGYHQHYVSAGDFAFITMTVFNIMRFVYTLHDDIVSLFKETGIAKQALHSISEPHEITDKPNATDLLVSQGEIVFNNVSFGYPSGRYLFNNISLIIQPGSHVGLVGFSGAGKTSLINLILRKYDIPSGSITIDGQDISHVTLHSLRKAISLIPQDTNLFHRSIKENIKYGNPHATDLDIIEAAKKADCHDWICKLPDGYSSIVGERGTKLSGGQRQRIAIARAFLKNAPIFILDEATSSLDSVTEGEVQKSLATLMEGKTSLVIAHRLSTLSSMQRIVVFKDGAIIEDGSHEELLIKDGHYAHLWNLQSKGSLALNDEIAEEE